MRRKQPRRIEQLRAGNSYSAARMFDQAFKSPPKGDTRTGACTNASVGTPLPSGGLRYGVDSFCIRRVHAHALRALAEFPRMSRIEAGYTFEPVPRLAPEQ